MNGLVEYGLPNGYRAEATTDAPCHLWLRWSRNKPKKHPRAKKVRGLWLMGDVYYCFTAHFDIEQEEAGDTSTHTFIMSRWPECKTRWFYLWGTIAGEVSPSESPFWGRHLFYTHHYFLILITHQNDSVYYNGTAITSAPPASPAWVAVGRLGNVADTIGGAFRFRNLQMPKYAEIIECRLVLRSASNQVKFPVHSQIAFENDANPSDFYNIDIPTFLARWATRYQVVDWDNMPPWFLLSWQESPLITTGFQAIVNKPDYAPENACVIFWDDFLQRTPWQAFAMRLGHASSLFPAGAPRIIAEYNHWQVEEVTL